MVFRPAGAGGAPGAAAIPPAPRIVRVYDFGVWDEREDELTSPAAREPLAGPPAVLRLPDEQEIRVQLIRRSREPDGWWAEVVVTLWGRLDLPTGRSGVEPAQVRIQVPMDALTPVPGQETAYKRVPTVDLIAPRPWVIVWRDEPAGDGDRGVLHRRGSCGAEHARTAEALNDQAARREVLAGWGLPGRRIAWCDVCCPQTSPQMRHLVGRAAGSPDERDLAGGA